MPFQDLPLFLALRELAPDVIIGGALLFPEVEAIHSKRERLGEILTKSAKETLRTFPPIELHRRMMGHEPEVSEIWVEIEAPRGSRGVAWSLPLRLRFHALRWRHGEEAWIAQVPVLGIEVVSAKEEELEGLTRRHILFALGRTRSAGKLFELVQLARVEKVYIEQRVVTAEIRTPAQIAADSDQKEEPKPVIEEVGEDLSKRNLARAYEMSATVEAIADGLGGRNARSVLLVGPAGVGKTAAVHELFRQNRFRTEKGIAPLWATGGARLVAGMSGFGMWQERCQRLVKEATKSGAVVHLGSLIELMEVGKAGGSGFGIASYLRPYLSRGDFLAIAECTPEQLAIVERANPHLLGVFQIVNVKEPAAAVLKKIMKSAGAEMAAKLREDTRHRAVKIPEPAVTEAGLDAIDQLHRRYATYSAAPGRPLRFLRNLLTDHYGVKASGEETQAQGVIFEYDSGGDRAAVGPAEVTQAFSRETGLPLFLLEDSQRLDLQEARGHFEERVIGQPEAVGLVTDLLATVKAALNRPARPIASLLFIGPTGVGKTEMAKSLAAYFFGDPQRMVRLDMSEYASPMAVARLVGTAWGTEGVLTSKVREQPFCVVLLDEFEKAHPAFFDLLLQMLGEGRLTDSAGRLADFSNAIVIMTSNLGAASFQSGRFGLVASSARDSAREAREHFTGAVREFLRPEMFNRIDRVVPFLPLEAKTIRKIADREIGLIARRDGVRQREMSLDVSEAAAALLARDGFDLLYGARPLKRAIERDLLAPLADGMNSYAGTMKLGAHVSEKRGKLAVEVRGLPATGVEPQKVTADHARAAAAIRREVQALARCSAVLSLRNEIYTIERIMIRKKGQNKPVVLTPAQRERLDRLKGIAEALEKLTANVMGLEEAVLLNLYEGAAMPFAMSEVGTRLEVSRQEYRKVLLQLYGLRWAMPHFASAALYGDAHAEMFALARAYAKVARGHEGTTTVAWFSQVGRNALAKHYVEEKETENFLGHSRAGVIGMVLGLKAPFAIARFEPEAGLHVFEEEKGKDPHAVLVEVSGESLEKYEPPKNVEFRMAAVGEKRRTYELARETVVDHVLGESFRFGGMGLGGALERAIEARLMGLVQRVVSE